MAIASAVASTAAVAQQPQASAAQRDALLQKLQESDADLARRLEREAALKSTLGTLAAERERINTELISIASRVQKAEAALTASEARLGELEVREQILKGSLKSQHARMARLLAAMQRMGRNPPPVIVTQRSDALAMARSAMLLGRAFPELRTEAQILRQQLASMVKVTTGIRTERKRLRDETVALAASQGELQTKLVEKRKAQQLSEQELANVRAEARRIRESGANIQELIAQLDKKITAATRLGAYNRRLREEREARAAQVRADQARADQAGADQERADRERAEQERVARLDRGREPSAQQPDSRKPGAPPATAPAAQSKSVAPTPKAERELAETRPGAELLPDGGASLRRADRLTPAIPFQRARGRVPKPARGPTVVAFNERLPSGRRSKGIVIETRPNAQVTAPADSWVVYAGPFRSYGQILILNAGDNYHIVLAGLSRVDVELGNFVLASEPVGAMGSGTRKPNGSLRSDLFVEFRRAQKPIDPAPWWRRGQVVAQR
ncbi:MAG: peptidoglycan DD-metalloendopeptidase family protein [Pseudomonadota bacterium]